MRRLQAAYAPILQAALRTKMLVLTMALILFTMAIITFNQLGGEFIPNLSEGDIATHLMIPPGSSLEQEIATTTKAEKLLLANFPEIDHIVSKIGSAEVPTDPMPMEVADVMIIMKDKKQWTSAKTKEEMFEKMETVLDDLPGVTTEFSQPIQMRFNELMTGVRSDVGVKIFGEDIDLLVSLGDQAQNIIKNIQGVEDARAETVSGLPQITIRYNKDKLALYGLNVSDLNQAVSMGFAGSAAGVIYEGEKKFDLVVRLAEPFRNDISHIENLYISLHSGNQIPLGQVADIRLERGPAQISREDGKRRIIVGFNVRGRDVESVVNEIEQKFASELELPVGYYIQYAGQFENLKRAKARLSIAVPIALALIFVLLYFTFNSIIQSLLIFTAIPLSAIGGVFALWIRDMPFSISAGIGFIALFGVAVLNGIVLIGYFNQLKKEGMSDIIERIKVGTEVRLRPVIMTAAVASLGFLPMALSHSAGAEVQKPLATVVIGGLITATLLTLLVLPILYYYSEKMKDKRISSSNITTVLLIVFSLSSTALKAQPKPITSLEEAIELAITSNGHLSASSLAIAKSSELQKRLYVLPKTQFSASFGQMNGSAIDQRFDISQNFNPFMAKANKQYGQAELNKSETQYKLAELQIKYQVREQWNDLNYLQSKLQLYEAQEKLWEKFSDYAQQKYDVGESNIIEKNSAALNKQSFELQINLLKTEVASNRIKLQATVNTNSKIIPSDQYTAIDWDNLADSTIVLQHPLLYASKQEVNISKSKSKIHMAEKRPEFSLGYFAQSIKGSAKSNGEIANDIIPRFQGMNIGLNISIAGKGYNTQIKATEIEAMIQTAKAEQIQKEFTSEYSSLVKQYLSQKENLNYYTKIALVNAESIGNSAKKAYESGDIGYLEYMQALRTKFDIELSHLTAIYNYNKSLNTLMYLLNQ